MPTPDTNQSKNELQARESFDLFKFYEEAAEKTKTHIWSQTSWILSLSTAVLAFSVNLYVQHHNVVGFLWIVWIAALVGAALCFYLIWTLAEFGDHIRRLKRSWSRRRPQNPPNSTPRTLIAVLLLHEISAVGRPEASWSRPPTARSEHEKQENDCASVHHACTPN